MEDPYAPIPHEDSAVCVSGCLPEVCCGHVATVGSLRDRFLSKRSCRVPVSLLQEWWPELID